MMRLLGNWSYWLAFVQILAYFNQTPQELANMSSPEDKNFIQMPGEIRSFHFWPWSDSEGAFGRVISGLDSI